MPEFENLENYQSRRDDGTVRISPIAPHSLQAVDYVLRAPKRDENRRHNNVPVVPKTDITPIDIRKMEKQFRQAYKKDRPSLGKRLVRSIRRLSAKLRSLFGSKAAGSAAAGSSRRKNAAKEGGRGKRGGATKKVAHKNAVKSPADNHQGGKRKRRRRGGSGGGRAESGDKAAQTPQANKGGGAGEGKGSQTRKRSRGNNSQNPPKKESGHAAASPQNDGGNPEPARKRSRNSRRRNRRPNKPDSPDSQS